MTTVTPDRSIAGPATAMVSRRKLDIPVVLTVWAGISALSMAQDNGLYFVAGTLAAGVNLVMALMERNLSAHRMIVNIGMVATTGFVLLQLVSGRPILTCLGQFIILIQIAKLFDRKTSRDATQLLLLSVMNMIIGALNTESLWFAIALLGYVMLLCHTAMVLTLMRGLEDGEGSLAAPPARTTFNIPMKWPGPTILGRLVVILGFVVITAVASFLVLPHTANLVTGMTQASPHGKMPTFGDPVQLGKPKNIQMSDLVVMYVSLDQAGGHKMLPMSARYLRGQVFYVYENKQWSRRPAYQLAPPARLAPTDSALCSNATVLNVSMISSMAPHVFAPHPLVRVDASGMRTSVNEYREGDIRAGSAGAYIRYSTWSLTPPFTATQHDYLARLHRKYLSPFGSDPRRGVEASDKVRQLANEWCADLIARRDQAVEQGQEDARDGYNEQIADRLALRLRERCKYTLDLTEIDPSANPLEEFLFRLRRGHCEYFATALTVMCRSLGVPARLATGFVMNEYNPAETRYIIRQNSAHAWTEIYTDAGDWTPKDATPAGDRIAPLRPWYNRMGEMWDNMEFMWFQTVLNYDDNTRNRLMQSVQDALAGAGNLIIAGFERVVQSLADLLPGCSLIAARVILLACILAILAGAAILVWRLWRWRRRRLILPSHRAVPPEFLALLRHLLDLLARRGVQRRPSQTLREYVAHAAKILKLPEPLLCEMIGLYYRARWGRVALCSGDLARVRQNMAQINETLKGM